MKEIQLKDNVVTLVDDDLYEYLLQFRWRYSKRTHGGWSIGCMENGKAILMHRLVINAPDGAYVDHIDGNSLNNTRENLRLCTIAQNAMNRPMQANNKTGYKGVAFSNREQRFRAMIQFNGKRIHIGYFKDAEAAARAYDNAAKKYFGEFAWINFK